MITIRQIERAWQARTYEKLFRELVANRPEASFRFEQEQGRAIPAAAMAVIRLEELSQSHVLACAQLLRAVIAGQETDGGWGDPTTTALCLRALLCCNGDGTAITRGLNYLADLQKTEGAWPAVPLRRMPADGFASAFILSQLGSNERFRDAVDFDAALNWLDRHEKGLTFDAQRMWEVAKLRCRAALPAREHRRQPVLAWS
jgi:hypothetical protein